MDKVYVYNGTGAPVVNNIVEIHKTACTYYTGGTGRSVFTFYRSIVYIVFVTADKSLVKCFTAGSVGARRQ
jgi:hypothetical protein